MDRGSLSAVDCNVYVFYATVGLGSRSSSYENNMCYDNDGSRVVAQGSSGSGEIRIFNHKGYIRSELKNEINDSFYLYLICIIL